MSRLLQALFSPRRMAGNRRLFMLCALLFVLSTLISFGLFFPAEVVQRRVVAEMAQRSGLQMQGNNAEILFPFGFGLDLTVAPPHPLLQTLFFSNLEIRPLWSSLFGNNRAADLKGELSEGQIEGISAQDGDLLLRLRNLQLAPLQNNTNDYLVKARATGVLSGEDLGTDYRGQGKFDFTLEQVTLEGLQRFGLPAEFLLGRAMISGDFRERRFSLHKVVFAEGMIELSGGGTMRIGDTPEQTRLNLNVRLHPVRQTPDSLRSLIQVSGVRPTSDGSYLIRIGGTLAKPIIR